MRTADFSFELPQELIAQTPMEPRDHSRLLTVSRRDGTIGHHRFYELPQLLRPGDLLLVNDSRVIPARLYGEKEGTGAAVELLLLERKRTDVWETLVRPGKKIKEGTRLVFGDGLLHAEVLAHLESGNRLVRFAYEGEFYALLDRVGQMPLPHYITRQLEDSERYQTVYARERGSAAAPTAGLHFTQELLAALPKAGIEVASVTLHVGLGTFRPVKEENILDHKMHAEHYCMTQETADRINACKARGGRVICVGTTSCRTLESIAAKHGKVVADEGYTDIFIYPGYSFRAMDGLITNFHLPESTLIMLVSAFLGYEKTMEVYRTAVEQRYRFYSFGDSMLVL